MSRTFKDRPYWVRNNSSAEKRREHHDHTRLGEAVYVSRPRLDEEGNHIYALEKKVHPSWWMQSSGFAYSQYEVRYAGSDEWVFIGEASKAAGNIRDWRAVPGNPEHGYERRFQYDRVLLGYRSEECDINEPLSRGERRWSRRSLRNCFYEVDWSVAGYSCSCSWCARGRGYDPTDRSRNRDILINAIKDYRAASENGDEDWWGDELDGCRNWEFFNTTTPYAASC